MNAPILCTLVAVGRNGFVHRYLLTIRSCGLKTWERYSLDKKKFAEVGTPNVLKSCSASGFRLNCSSLFFILKVLAPLQRFQFVT
jgi:hypothetical protein